MPTFRVTVRELRFKSETFECKTEDEAKDLAEEKDWSEWQEDDSLYSGESEIVEVERLE